MFDHDLGLLCREKCTHTSGHCDFGNLNNFGNILSSMVGLKRTLRRPHVLLKRVVLL